MGISEKIIENLNDIFDFEKNPAITGVSNITEMEFSKMKPFPGHIFKLYEGQQLEDMVESIKQFGILIPIIVWRKDNKAYTILSGHNRVNAGKLAGLTKGPVVIKENLSDEDAVLIVTETNLRQRSFSDMSHSERALSLSQHYEAMKCQGHRTDLIKEIETLLNPHGKGDNSTCVQVEHKLKNRDKTGSEYGLSATNVTRYIRIATLVPELLYSIDAKEIAFLAAYTLSFIEDKNKQTLIAEIINREDCKIDMKKASLLREYYEKNKLTDKAVEDIIMGVRTSKNKNDKPKSYKVKSAVLKKYFNAGESQAEVDDIIEKALDMYFESQNNE